MSRRALVLVTATLAACTKPAIRSETRAVDRSQTAQVGSPALSALPGAQAERVPVRLFVMSKCPFAAQAELVLAPLLAKFGAHVDLAIDFIGSERDGALTSMHGPTEVDGDRVQLCIMKRAPGDFWPALSCMNRDMQAIPGNWEACARQAGLDLDAIRACYEGPEGKDLLRASFEESARNQAAGSPTILVAGTPYNGSRTDLALGRALCAAFQEPRPAPCAAIPPPVRIPVVILNDRRCEACQREPFETRLKQLLPGAEITALDYGDPAGRKLFDDLGLEALPALLLGEEVREDESFAQLGRFLTPVGKFLALRIRATFDPRKEICDNGIDDTLDGLTDCADPGCAELLACRPEIPKRLEVFVMSACPFAVRALDAMRDVLAAFGRQIDFRIHYIAETAGDGFRSLHGQAEVEEDLRALCAIAHYPKDNKFMDYIWCRNENFHSSDWKPCTGKNGIAAETIETCATGPEGVELLKKDIAIGAALQVVASPTWLANNRATFMGIDAESIRKGFCEHNPSLQGCDKKLPTAPPGQATCQ